MKVQTLTLLLQKLRFLLTKDVTGGHNGSIVDEEEEGGDEEQQRFSVRNR